MGVGERKTKCTCSKSYSFPLPACVHVPKWRRQEQPRVSVRTLSRCGLRACQRAPVVRAKLSAIPAGFPQTLEQENANDSVVLQENPQDHNESLWHGPTSPHFLRGSQSTWEQLHHRGVCYKSGKCTQNLRGTVHSAAFYSWNSTAARDQTTGRFCKRYNTHGAQMVVLPTVAGSVRMGGKMGSLTRLNFKECHCDRLLEQHIHFIFHL